MFSLHQNLAALCGRYNIHIFPTTTLSRHVETVSLDLRRSLPKESKSIPDKLSAICCDISEDGKMLVAGDSEKNVYVWECTNKTWDLVGSWTMDKRITKVGFDRKIEQIVVTDKTGDVYVVLKGPHSVFSPPLKILGHTSYVLDVVITADNSQIITCDRDEKIRISDFPNAFEVNEFKLGHEDAVVSLVLVNEDRALISISSEGTLKMWRLVPKKRMPLLSVNVIHLFGQPCDPAHQVFRMKGTDTGGRAYLAVQIAGYKELPVFELMMQEKTVRVYGVVKLEQEFVDFCWNEKSMFVYFPELGKVSKYCISSHGGLLKEENFVLPILDNVLLDLKEFAVFNRPFLSAKKRFSTYGTGKSKPKRANVSPLVNKTM